MQKPLHVGFVGTGFIAQFQAQAMAQTRGLELTAQLKRKGSEKLSALARDLDLGPATPYSSVSEMAKNVDVIAIYCPNAFHLEILEEIASAKKKGAAVRGVVCEKPMGRNLKDARSYVQIAEEAGLLTGYFENQIHMKAVQAQLRQLKPQQETMGPLHLTRSAEEHAGPHMPWFWDPVRQGGGVLCDMGCHSIAVGWYALTPIGKPLTFLQPQSISCQVALLKWGQPHWREQLLKKHGVDYQKTPAEDFATGIITFKNPETGQLVKSQFTDSWMFEKQGLRLFMDGMGPGYAFEINTLLSPLSIFIGDEAAEATANAETALEKATASRGLLAVQYNEADLYGYVDENRDMAENFAKGRHALLPFSYGYEITRLVMAGYLSAEKGRVVDLTDPQTQQELETFVPAVQRGLGADLLYRA